jgi:hypothetical protein
MIPWPVGPDPLHVICISGCGPTPGQIVAGYIALIGAMGMAVAAVWYAFVEELGERRRGPRKRRPGQ